MKKTVLVWLLSAGLASFACAEGSSKAPPGKAASASHACTVAKDCHGMLPHMCRACGDGTTQCAHFACTDNVCHTELCEGHDAKK